MIAPTTLLLGLGLPMLLAALLLAAARRFGSAWSDASSGLALALGYAAGHVGFLGWPPFPARVAEGWTPYLALLAAVLATLSTAARRPVAWLVRAVILAVGLVLWLRPMIEYRWTAPIAATWIAALLTAALLACVGLDLTLPGLAPRTAWASVACWFAGIAASLALSGSLALGLVGGSAAAAAGGGFLATIFGISGRPAGRGATLVLVTLAGGLLLCGGFYSALPPVCAILLAVAPLVPRALPAGLRGKPSLGGVLVAVSLVALVGAVAAAIAYRSLVGVDEMY